MAINLSTLVNQTNPLQLCKAWVNFNGSTASINSSYNVSSVTKNGTGNYTINFATVMANPNYATCASLKADNDSASGRSVYCPNSGVYSINAVQLVSTYSSTSTGFIDYPSISVQIFGN